MGLWHSSPELKAMNDNPIKFADNLKLSSKWPIWKTTRPIRGVEGPGLDNTTTMTILKKQSITFLDAYEILKPFRMENDMYDDHCHFKPFIYALLNKHMLLLFEQLLH